MQTNNSKVFGRNFAGNAESITAVLIRPEVIIRIFIILFSIVVFSTVSAGAYNGSICLFNANTNACNFATAIGSVTFAVTLVYLILDFFIERMSNLRHRKRTIQVDVCFSSIWMFMWMIVFAFLTNEWVNNQLGQFTMSKFNRTSCVAAISFSFLTFLLSILLCYFNFRRYRSNKQDLFMTGDQIQEEIRQMPYSSYPGLKGGVSDLAPTRHAHSSHVSAFSAASSSSSTAATATTANGGTATGQSPTPPTQPIPGPNTAHLYHQQRPFTVSEQIGQSSAMAAAAAATNQHASAAYLQYSDRKNEELADEYDVSAGDVQMETQIASISVRDSSTSGFEPGVY